jgi:hypothetical protein
MNTLRWLPFPEISVDHYNIYRSIIGFRAPLVALPVISGKTLILKMNGKPQQTITFDATTGIVAKINATLVGGRAYGSTQDAAYFFLRSDIREAPGKVEILGGTALPFFGLSARAITEKSEHFVIAHVAALADTAIFVEYLDADGTIQDWYAISTADSEDNESLLTAFRQPISSSGEVCVLEGIIIDIQGVRVPDLEITARLMSFPQSLLGTTGIATTPVSTLTGPDGRFSFPLLQGAVVLLEIPSIQYSRNINVPATPFEFITDLSIDLDYRYPLDTEV